MNTRPAVLILRAPSVQADIIEPVLWGIEEEGVPYEIGDGSNEPATELAKQAANGSALNVGIAMNEAGEIVLHHRDLPAGMPLFVLSAKLIPLQELRRLGTNAARLVKGQPLVLDAPKLPQGLNNPGSSAQNVLDDLIRLIVGEILKEQATQRGNRPQAKKIITTKDTKNTKGFY